MNPISVIGSAEWIHPKSSLLLLSPPPTALMKGNNGSLRPLSYCSAA